MNFNSVSSDGRVVNYWKLVKNELQCQDAILLKIPGASVDGPEGTQQQVSPSWTWTCIPVVPIVAFGYLPAEILITPRACARGKVIGRVVVVVSKKIAISGGLGT